MRISVCDVCVHGMFSPEIKSNPKCEIYCDRQRLCREWNQKRLNNGMKGKKMPEN